MRLPSIAFLSRVEGGAESGDDPDRNSRRERQSSSSNPIRSDDSLSFVWPCGDRDRPLGNASIHVVVAASPLRRRCAEGPSVSTKFCSVLVVDDEPYILATLSSLLESADYEVLTAASGEAA